MRVGYHRFGPVLVVLALVVALVVSTLPVSTVLATTGTSHAQRGRHVPAMQPRDESLRAVVTAVVGEVQREWAPFVHRPRSRPVRCVGGCPIDDRPVPPPLARGAGRSPRQSPR